MEVLERWKSRGGKFEIAIEAEGDDCKVVERVNGEQQACSSGHTRATASREIVIRVRDAAVWGQINYKLVHRLEVTVEQYTIEALDCHSDSGYGPVRKCETIEQFNKYANAPGVVDMLFRLRRNVDGVIVREVNR